MNNGESDFKTAIEHAERLITEGPVDRNREKLVSCIIYLTSVLTQISIETTEGQDKNCSDKCERIRTLSCEALDKLGCSQELDKILH